MIDHASLLLVCFVVVITTLIADVIVLLLPKPPRFKQYWILLWHVPMWFATVYIGFHVGLPEFAIPVRFVR